MKELFIFYSMILSSISKIPLLPGSEGITLFRSSASGMLICECIYTQLDSSFLYLICIRYCCPLFARRSLKRSKISLFSIKFDVSHIHAA